MKNKLKALSLIFIIATGLISCKGKDAHKTIRLSYVDWAEGVAMTTVAKTVLEENGFKVKYKLGDINPIFSAISRGTSDAFLDVWVPVTDRKSTRLNSSHVAISYAVFCLKKKTRND